MINTGTVIGVTGVAAIRRALSLTLVFSFSLSPLSPPHVGLFARDRVRDRRKKCSENTVRTT